MLDPVIAEDGHTYERAEIERALRISNKSPIMGVPMQSTKVVPNVALRNIMAAAGVKGLIPLSQSGLVTKEQATAFAKEITARKGPRSNTGNIMKAAEYIRQQWYKAVRDAAERGDFFVAINITHPRGGSTIATGRFTKLGPGVNLEELRRVSGLPEYSSYHAMCLLSKCAWDMGFYCVSTFSDATSKTYIAFTACRHSNDEKRVIAAEKKYE